MSQDATNSNFLNYFLVCAFEFVWAQECWKLLYWTCKRQKIIFAKTLPNGDKMTKEKCLQWQRNAAVQLYCASGIAQNAQRTDNFHWVTGPLIHMNEPHSIPLHGKKELLLPFKWKTESWTYEQNVIDKMNDIATWNFKLVSHAHISTAISLFFASEFNARYFVKPQKTLAKVKKMR